MPSTNTAQLRKDLKQNAILELRPESDCCILVKVRTVLDVLDDFETLLVALKFCAQQETEAGEVGDSTARDALAAIGEWEDHTEW